MSGMHVTRRILKSQQTDQREPNRAANLWAPLDDAPGEDHGAHGVFDDQSHSISPQWWLREHAKPVTFAAGTVLAGSLGIAARRRS